MKYVIVTIEWCNNHGIIIPKEARKSLDGTKVIFHEDYILPVIQNEKSSELIIYEHDNKELWDILNSLEWTEQEEETINEE